MKPLTIEKNKAKKIEVIEKNFEAEFLKQMSEYKILESHIIYFSAGDAKIKEILIKKDPSFSI